jgi:hypothetical protein
MLAYILDLWILNAVLTEYYWGRPSIPSLYS